ncbi:MAG TPA: sigma 54-interacting transcriptional regulator [Planctomycetota bacterium]|nr:sigma 54-interacting transcriptional regulator [Planctomycetota bacterium]
MAFLIIRGPHGRQVCELKATNVVGRGTQTDIALHDPLASKRHFQLRELNGEWLIRDLESTNGTIVCGRKIDGETPLNDGDEISIGDESLIFTLAKPADAADASESGTFPTGLLSTPVEKLGFALPDAGKSTLVAAPGSPHELSFWLRGLYRLLRVAHLAQSEDELLKLIRGTLQQTLPGTQISLVIEPRGEGGTRILNDGRKLSATMMKLLAFARQRCVAVLSPDVEAATNASGKEHTSLLVAPLLSGRQALGYLCFEHRWSPEGSALLGRGPLTQAHLDFAAAVAYPMASMLENLRRTQSVLLENEKLRRGAGSNREIIGQSSILKETLSIAERIAATNTSVLIYGESGTGKELVARAIHFQSPRRTGPFVAINCGALPQELIESELFGHARGAFTGAISHREGCFESASGGTLFLDEVGELPLTAQTRLLRVLQESVIVRVGENKPRQVDCRIIAATHRNLEADVKSGRFRQDLFYRLKVVDISLPPLRKRVDDLPLLCEHLLEPFGQFRIHPDAMEILRKYRWPGNVRELKNVLERMAVLARPLGQPATGVITLTVDDIPMELRRAIEGGQRVTTVQPRKIAGLRSGDADADVFAITPDLMLSLEPLHVQYARWVVKQLGGNKTKAAKALGIQRATLYAWLERGSEEPEATDTRE